MSTHKSSKVIQVDVAPHSVSATLAERYRRIAQLFGAAVGLLGLGNLIGYWLLPAPGQDPVTAFGLLCAAGSLILQTSTMAPRPASKWAARAGAAIVLLIGMSAFAPVFSTTALAPMHPACAVGFLLTGCGLLLQDSHGAVLEALGEYLAFAIIAFSLLPLVGLAYQAPALMYLGSTEAIWWPFALALLALGTALLLARPRRRLMALLTDDVPGAVILRSTLPLALLLLIVLNWIVHRGAMRGWYAHAMVSPLLTLFNSGVILIIFWRTAETVNKAHLDRLRSAAALSEANSLLIAVSDNTDDPIFVKNCQGQLIFANPATLQLIGKSRDQAMMRCSRDLFVSQKEADQIDLDDQRIMQNGVSETLEQTLHLPHGVRTYTSTKAPWFDSEGRLRGIIGISTDISARKEMERQLKRHEAELEETISQRTATLRKLADHLETVREEEKRAIARELHDDMGASLTSLNMHLTTIYAVLPQEPKWADRIERVQALVAALVATTRRIQIGLRPIMLDLFGLKAGVTEQVEEFGERTGIVGKLSLPDEDVNLAKKLEITLYRMLQEALNNVAKHAQASEVEVILDIDEDFATLTVRDNGVGIAPERIENQSTYGIRGFCERAAFLGGTARVFANANGGTTVRVELPATLSSDANQDVDEETF